MTALLAHLRYLIVARRLAREQRWLNKALTRDGEQEMR